MPEIAGKRFGRWLVLDRSGSDKYRRALWRCKCKCGVGSMERKPEELMHIKADEPWSGGFADNN